MKICRRECPATLVKTPMTRSLCPPGANAKLCTFVTFLAEWRPASSV